MGDSVLRSCRSQYVTSDRGDIPLSAHQLFSFMQLISVAEEVENGQSRIESLLVAVSTPLCRSLPTANDVPT